MSPAAAGTGQTEPLFEAANPEDRTDVEPLSVAGVEKGKSGGNNQGDKSGGNPPSCRNAVGRFS